MFQAPDRLVTRRWRMASCLIVAAVGLIAVPGLADRASAAPITSPAVPLLAGAPCEVPLVSTACDAISAVANGVTALPTSVAGDIAESVASWIASGAASLVSEAGRAITATTTVSLRSRDGTGQFWFLDRYRLMVGIAALLMAPMLLLAVLHAVFTQSGGLLTRAVANLPLAALGTAGAITIVELLLGATDWASAQLAATIPGDTNDVLAGVAQALVHTGVAVPGAGPAVSSFGVALLGLFMALVALAVWLELVVREAAVYLTVLFLPIGFATYVWPALSVWLRRLVEIIVALILSKLVIVAALSLAGGALAAQEGFGTLVAGAGMLLLAAFAPFALFKLLPIASLAAISSLEGVSRRAPRAVTPRLTTMSQVRSLAASAALPARTGTGSIGGGRPAPPPPAGSGGWSLPPSGGGPLPGTGPAIPAPGGGVATTAVSAASTGAASAMRHARQSLDAPLPFPSAGDQQ